MLNKHMNYLEMPLHWVETEDVDYPYQTQNGSLNLKIKLNDFPEEVMYSLIVNDELILSFDDWPKKWIR